MKLEQVKLKDCKLIKKKVTIGVMSDNCYILGVKIQCDIHSLISTYLVSSELLNIYTIFNEPKMEYRFDILPDGS